jgi:hypothetical protein
MTKEAILEGLKEPLRLLVLALIPLLINWISGQAWDAQFIAIVLIILRAVDKILHDIGKEAGNEVLEGGLTRF